MHHKRPPLPAIILIILVVVVGGYFIVSQALNSRNGRLAASGTIEAVQINVAPELPGKVIEVPVEEGQEVDAGDALLQLDPSLLAAQRDAAAAALEAAMAGERTAQEVLATAQAQYQSTLQAALAQHKNTRLQDWFTIDPDQFDQPEWYFYQAEMIQAAQDQVDEAKKRLEEAETNLTNVTQSLEKADFLKAEKRLLDARVAYLIAKDVNYRAQNSVSEDTPKGVYNRTHCGTNQGYFEENARVTNQLYSCSGDQDLAAAGEELYYEARDELEAAQEEYDKLLSTGAAGAVQQARAEISVAQEQYYSALDFLRELQTGDQSPSVVAAQGVVDQARAMLSQAQKARQQAQANLDLSDIQIDKLTVIAPVDSTVLTRTVEIGEYVQPGATAFVLGQLDDLTITVYVPEDRYGEISLGQTAEVTVDSFPDEVFEAAVVQIADKAEFTPRNVQTVEGRSSTVFAIKLKVRDPEGKLKSGMPADVLFK